MYRDIRWSHPFAAYVENPYEPVMLQKGDVWSRAMLRKLEVEKSIAVIRDLVTRHSSLVTCHSSLVTRHPSLHPSSLAISLTEGWRGEICHLAVTDESGKIILYKAKDPSVHNWMALAVAMRNQEISDFPLTNKSFNLSYCGHDL
jgi:Ni,Fe-hydrogenase III large subunit